MSENPDILVLPDGRFVTDKDPARALFEKELRKELEARFPQVYKDLLRVATRTASYNS